MSSFPVPVGVVMSGHTEMLDANRRLDGWTSFAVARMAEAIRDICLKGEREVAMEVPRGVG